MSSLVLIGITISPSDIAGAIGISWLAIVLVVWLINIDP